MSDARRSSGKIRSNDRMPARSQSHVFAMVDKVHGMRSAHRSQATGFMRSLGPESLFELLHCMRRWYSGQTMARRLALYRPALATVMKLSPRDVVGVYRGFKVPASSPIASLMPGDRIRLPVTLNHGFSSWSTTEAPTHKFSGGGRGKVGLVVRLASARGVLPVLAPPDRTSAWFNALYAEVIGKSFRPHEGEYLIASPEVVVDVVRVKR